MVQSSWLQCLSRGVVAGAYGSLLTRRGPYALFVSIYLLCPFRFHLLPSCGRPEHHDGSFGFTPLPAAGLACTDPRGIHRCHRTSYLVLEMLLYLYHIFNIIQAKIDMISFSMLLLLEHYILEDGYEPWRTPEDSAREKRVESARTGSASSCALCHHF